MKHWEDGMSTIKAVPGNGKMVMGVGDGKHSVTMDVPPDLGGEDTGMKPHDFLAGALAACTAMTIKMYAQRKGWGLTTIEVECTSERVKEGEKFDRVVRLGGNLDPDQRQRLMTIANSCPVHKVLTGKILVETREG